MLRNRSGVFPSEKTELQQAAFAYVDLVSFSAPLAPGTWNFLNLRMKFAVPPSFRRVTMNSGMGPAFIEAPRVSLTISRRTRFTLNTSPSLI